MKFSLHYIIIFSLACHSICFANEANTCTDAFKGSAFLHSRNSLLHNTFAVNQAATKASLTVTSKPQDKIQAWISYLEISYKKGLEDPHHLERIRQFYLNASVIKEGDVSQSYFDLQVKIAREQGHGNLQITPQVKSQLSKLIIADQKQSLEEWHDYLLGPDSFMYPMWAKYWCFDGLLKLGKFDSNKKVFLKRSRGTTAPFPELNPEALSYVMDRIVERVQGTTLSTIQDPKLLKLIEGAQFGALYAHALTHLTTVNSDPNVTEGKWVKYNRGPSDHQRLYQSLQGMSTGWCTAGAKTAEAQLANGDFYVYYSNDLLGRSRIPRIAIRMSGSSIAEIRGRAKTQSLDSEIAATPILENKLKDFGEEGAMYQKKARDMKHLTEIQEKIQNGSTLSKQNLHFLYEIEENIQGFGYGRDPRIEKSLANRNKREDIVRIFDGQYASHEISLTADEALSGKSKFHFGDLALGMHGHSINGKNLPMIVRGTITIYQASISNVTFPKRVTGSLLMPDTETIKASIFPDIIGGKLDLRSLRSLKSLILPKFVGGDLDLYGLKFLENVRFPIEVGGNLKLGQVEVATDVILPKKVEGYLDLFYLMAAKNVVMPETISGYWRMYNLQSDAGITLPKSVGGEIIVGFKLKTLAR